ncbi:hypothetical protein GALL_524990 [mine drainage metagenome]|uniref:Uncharacterized protein n=1 Tax=mine drainage metagenome TaxID=410659 RepID=A0A1J5P497_9ZZZZ
MREQRIGARLDPLMLALAGHAIVARPLTFTHHSGDFRDLGAVEIGLIDADRPGIGHVASFLGADPVDAKHVALCRTRRRESWSGAVLLCRALGEVGREIDQNREEAVRRLQLAGNCPGILEERNLLVRVLAQQSRDLEFVRVAVRGDGLGIGLDNLLIQRASGPERVQQEAGVTEPFAGPVEVISEREKAPGIGVGLPETPGVVAGGHQDWIETGAVAQIIELDLTGADIDIDRRIVQAEGLRYRRRFARECRCNTFLVVGELELVDDFLRRRRESLHRSGTIRSDARLPSKRRRPRELRLAVGSAFGRDRQHDQLGRDAMLHRSIEDLLSVEIENRRARFGRSMRSERIGRVVLEKDPGVVKSPTLPTEAVVET